MAEQPVNDASAAAALAALRAAAVDALNTDKAFLSKTLGVHIAAEAKKARESIGVTNGARLG